MGLYLGLGLGLGGSGGGAASYLGQVATRAYSPTALQTSIQYLQQATKHVACDAISQIRVGFPNFALHASNGEVSNSATATVIAATIEYPVGTTYTALLFSGSPSGTVADKSFLLSDILQLPVTIPAGATFWIRANLSSAVGFTTIGKTGGNLSRHSTSPMTDITQGQTLTSTGTVLVPPNLILAPTAKKSGLLITDSRGAGLGDTRDVTNNAAGELERPWAGVGAYGAPYCQSGISGNSIVTINDPTKFVNQLAMSAYFTHIACNMGINDLEFVNAATCISRMNTFIAKFGSKPVHWNTIAPRSSGAWTNPDLSDQTTHASNADRVTVNTAIRALSGINIAGYFEGANAVESSLNSGKWKAPGETADGLHETLQGYLDVKAAIQAAVSAMMT